MTLVTEAELIDLEKSVRDAKAQSLPRIWHHGTGGDIDADADAIHRILHTLRVYQKALNMAIADLNWVDRWVSGQERYAVEQHLTGAALRLRNANA